MESYNLSSDNLSSDIILDILTRVSLRILGKSRLVCKEWNHITYEPSFMLQYCERTGIHFGYYIQSITKNKYSSTFVALDKFKSISSLSLDFLPIPVKIEASSNQGILCCVSQEPQNVRNVRIPSYFVCKPSTKQWQLIPNPKTRFFTLRIAMIVLRSNPLRYKIVRLSQPKFSSKEYNNLRCEIFNSKNWAWKQSNEIQLPIGVILDFNPALLARGTIHWLTTDDRVFAFDPEEESWTIFSLPRPVYENKDYWNKKQLVEFKGNLALICIGKDESMELWVMEDYGNRVWNKRQRLSIEAIRKEEKCAYPVAFYNADIALMKGYYQVIFYKFQNCSSNIVRLEKHRDANEVFAFRSDLEPTNLKGVEADLGPSNLV